MSLKATFAYEPTPRLLDPNPDPRDRTTAEYREHRDTVMRPDIRRRGVQAPLVAWPHSFYPRAATLGPQGPACAGRPVAFLPHHDVHPKGAHR